ncbi:transporter permease [Actinobacillus equuli]|nr:transporter permease [Actinobacillus equuli]
MAQILLRPGVHSHAKRLFIYLMKYKDFDSVQIASAFSLLVFASQAFSLLPAHGEIASDECQLCCSGAYWIH